MPDAMTLANSTPYPAEFFILQGPSQSSASQVARIGVPGGGSCAVPTGNSYTVSAQTQVGDITVTSNTLAFDQDQIGILAQVMMDQPNFYAFQISTQPPTQSSAIVLENTWREPVTFNVSMNGSPMASVQLVDGHNTSSVSTLEQFWIYAIVNGITTQTASTSDPDATITAVSDNFDDGFNLRVS